MKSKNVVTNNDFVLARPSVVTSEGVEPFVTLEGNDSEHALNTPEEIVENVNNFYDWLECAQTCLDPEGPLDGPVSDLLDAICYFKIQCKEAWA
jgi:hypothetical protein